MEKDKKLTEREKEVLNSLGIIGSRDKIAKSLNIEKTTVDKHVEAIYRKYGVQEKGGALLFGIYNNDIDLDALIAARLARKKEGDDSQD